MCYFFLSKITLSHFLVYILRQSAIIREKHFTNVKLDAV